MQQLNTLAVVVVAALVVATCSRAHAAGDREKTITSQPLGVKFAVPAKWEPNEVELPALNDKMPPTKSISLDPGNGDDESSTAIAIKRWDRKLSADESKERVAAAIEEMRRSFKLTEAKTLRDEEIKIAGTTGRVIEGEVTMNGKSFGNTVVSFVLDGYEYRLFFNGKKEHYDRLKPAVERMIATMERTQ